MCKALTSSEIIKLPSPPSVSLLLSPLSLLKMLQKNLYLSCKFFNLINFNKKIHMVQTLQEYYFFKNSKSYPSASSSQLHSPCPTDNKYC